MKHPWTASVNSMTYVITVLLTRFYELLTEPLNGSRSAKQARNKLYSVNNLELKIVVLVVA